MASDVDGTRLTALEEKIKDLESELAGMRSHLSALLAGLVDLGRWTQSMSTRSPPEQFCLPRRRHKALRQLRRKL